MRLNNFRQVRIGVETVIYIILFGLMTIQLSSPLRVSFLVSLGTWMIAISSVVLFVFSVLLKNNFTIYFYGVIALTATVFLSIIFSRDISYQNLVVALSFLEIPLCIASCPSISSKRIKKTIFICFFILSVYYTLLSFTNLSNIYYTKYGERYMSFLTLGYKNPNETAMYLFVCLIVLVCLFIELKKIIFKVLVAIDILLILRLIWLTESRTAVIISLLFFIFVIIFNNRAIPSFIRMISFATPLVFVLINTLFKEQVAYWYILGEGFDTGRLEIYSSVLDTITFKTFLFGNYNYSFENLHNSFISIFSTIGVIGMLMYYCFLYAKFYDIHETLKENHNNNIAFIGFLCIVVYSSVEAAFFTIGGVFAVSVFSIYLLSVSDIQIHENLSY